ncbi:hypothetical protein OE88DRAFT_1598942, partial [Heliocybe sulcata]
LTQVVNSLTVKMEIGAPMACAYLLGNPDHYTSHHFKPVYWKSYVTEVLNEWDDDPSMHSASEAETKFNNQVLVKRSKEGYTICKHHLNNKSKENKDETEEESQITVDSKTHSIKDTKLDPTELMLLRGHPQHETHYITIVKEIFSFVPNFIGGSLPRRDAGNREFYCVTMLTLFKPWRSGKDLKLISQTWDDAFTAFNFSHRQEELMNFFNIKYECYDARDDYAKQRK